MPNSMTGFASADVVCTPFQMVWEIRSVNHRYLDISFRMPEDFRKLETEFRDRVGAVLKRGKVDCTLKLATQSDTGGGTAIDTDLVSHLGRLQATLRAQLPDARAFSVHELLRWPGVIIEPAQDLAVLGAPATECLERAVAALQAARAREGERIKALLEERNAGIIELIGLIKPRLDDLQLKHRDKLRERLEKLGVQADPERLEQELALIAQRLDVAEEIDRLSGHVAEARAVLEGREPVGRRLDFLIQELNREANTFASKVQEDELTRCAVDLKVLIEQMREQAQNLE